MLDIPFGDSFYTKLIHTVSQDDSNKSCQISITATVYFTKKILLEGRFYLKKSNVSENTSTNDETYEGEIRSIHCSYER